MRFAAIIALIAITPALAFPATIIVPDDYIFIQDAIDAASSGDTIVVRPGRYVENIDFLGKAIVLMSAKGSNVTQIDGNKSGSVVKFDSGEGADSRIEGFTIMNGLDRDGGGIYCGYLASPTISNCRVWKNLAVFYGGGIYSFSSVTVTECAVIGNQAGSLGAGISCNGDGATITDCNISFNTTQSGWGGGVNINSESAVVARSTIKKNSALYGGGIFCGSQYSKDVVISGNLISLNSAAEGGGVCCAYDSEPTVTGNTITFNSAKFGGGFASGLSEPVLVNNIIARNMATGDGGGLYFNSSEAIVINNTIVENSAANHGGGIYGQSLFMIPLMVTNTILWGNEAPDGPEFHDALTTHLFFDYCDIRGGSSSGTGNIDADPLFCVAGGDYHLTWDSPCRNAGSANAAGIHLPPEDIEGDRRLAGANVDIGADEYFFHLYHVGYPEPGDPLSFRIVGLPGQHVALALGSGIHNPPIGTPYGDLHLKRPSVNYWRLGPIPPDGILIAPATLPSWWVPGDRKPFQALVGALGGPRTRLTNLMVLKVD